MQRPRLHSQAAGTATEHLARALYCCLRAEKAHLRRLAGLVVLARSRHHPRSQSRCRDRPAAHLPSSEAVLCCSSTRMAAQSTVCSHRVGLEWPLHMRAEQRSTAVMSKLHEGESAERASAWKVKTTTLKLPGTACLTECCACFE